MEKRGLRYKGFLYVCYKKYPKTILWKCLHPDCLSCLTTGTMWRPDDLKRTITHHHRALFDVSEPTGLVEFVCDPPEQWQIDGKKAEVLRQILAQPKVIIQKRKMPLPHQQTPSDINRRFSLDQKAKPSKILHTNRRHTYCDSENIAKNVERNLQNLFKENDDNVKCQAVKKVVFKHSTHERKSVAGNVKNKKLRNLLIGIFGEPLNDLDDEPKCQEPPPAQMRRPSLPVSISVPNSSEFACLKRKISCDENLKCAKRVLAPPPLNPPAPTHYYAPPVEVCENLIVLDWNIPMCGRVLVHKPERDFCGATVTHRAVLRNDSRVRKSVSLHEQIVKNEAIDLTGDDDCFFDANVSSAPQVKEEQVKREDPPGISEEARIPQTTSTPLMSPFSPAQANQEAALPPERPPSALQKISELIQKTTSPKLTTSTSTQQYPVTTSTFTGGTTIVQTSVVAPRQHCYKATILNNQIVQTETNPVLPPPPYPSVNQQVEKSPVSNVPRMTPIHNLQISYPQFRVFTNQHLAMMLVKQLREFEAWQRSTFQFREMLRSSLVQEDLSGNMEPFEHYHHAMLQHFGEKMCRSFDGLIVPQYSIREVQSCMGDVMENAASSRTKCLVWVFYNLSKFLGQYQNHDSGLFGQFVTDVVNTFGAVAEFVQSRNSELGAAYGRLWDNLVRVKQASLSSSKSSTSVPAQKQKTPTSVPQPTKTVPVTKVASKPKKTVVEQPVPWSSRQRLQLQSQIKQYHEFCKWLDRQHKRTTTTKDTVSTTARKSLSKNSENVANKTSTVPVTLASSTTPRNSVIIQSSKQKLPVAETRAAPIPKPREPPKTPVTTTPPTPSASTVEVVDLTWIEDDTDDNVFSEIIEPTKNQWIVKSEEADEHRIYENVSPADSGVGSPEIQKENEYICLCGNPAVFVCRCQNYMYCSKECQVQDWVYHQPMCDKLSRST